MYDHGTVSHDSNYVNNRYGTKFCWLQVICPITYVSVTVGNLRLRGLRRASCYARVTHFHYKTIGADRPSAARRQPRLPTQQLKDTETRTRVFCLMHVCVRACGPEL